MYLLYKVIFEEKCHQDFIFSQLQKTEGAEAEGEGGAAGEAASVPEWTGERFPRRRGVTGEDPRLGPDHMGGSFI